MGGFLLGSKNFRHQARSDIIHTPINWDRRIDQRRIFEEADVFANGCGNAMHSCQSGFMLVTYIYIYIVRECGSSGKGIIGDELDDLAEVHLGHRMLQ